MGVAGVITFGVGLVLLIAFLVAIATVVRRNRPDVAPILLGAVIFECLISIASYAMQVVLPRFGGWVFSLGSSSAGSSGTSSYVEAYVLSNTIFSVAHAMARACLLWGIVRLAEPPSR